jgi:prepilin-type N-terminal cleavage/methylation domain-containing protein
MNIRRGFTLVEIMVVIIIIPFAAIFLDRLFSTLLSDIPRSSAVVQENTTLLDMLRKMRKTDDELLIVEGPDEVICYQLKEGQVVRYVLQDAQDDGDEDTRAWLVPNAVVQWHVWRSDGKGYAVEVKTHVRQKLRKKQQKKLANSHLYFVGVF